jgi:hypothetical protein
LRNVDGGNYVEDLDIEGNIEIKVTDENVKFTPDYTGSEYNSLFSFTEQGNGLFLSLENKDIS